jgi:serine/threonine protein kinase
MIPIYDAVPRASDKWCKIVLGCLDDAQTGQDIKPDLYQPHTFDEWITRRFWVPRPSGHGNRAVIGHIKAILNALHYFHQKDLVMNDAKPENFGFYEGRLVTIDFGGFGRRDVPPYEYDLAYSPPELREGHPQEDLYAVAVMLGEALYNIAPQELTPLQVNDLAEPYLKEKRLFDNVAWHILATGLSLLPGIRYQDAPAMLKDLDQLEGLL